jgi:hypothetical protein
MDYLNTQMKLDQLISYLNDKKINLVPPFQRGRVWPMKLRQGLIKNMVEGRPIPAIFLYKEAVGSKYSYNILDGKQRLESLILFVGNGRTDINIPAWGDYFFGTKHKKDVNFPVVLSRGKTTFKTLDEQVVRDFREYAIPTIEISLDDDDSSLDEIISLFVDINQYGVRVNRFDIVKAMAKNPLLQSVFDLIAISQKRKSDSFYRRKRTDFTSVLLNLQIIENIADPNSRIDRMWERLLEIALFARTHKHRAPTQILKGFIGGSGDRKRLSVAEVKRLQNIFSFLKAAYVKPSIAKARVATDQTHFYTMVTSLLSVDLISKYGARELIRRIESFATILDGKVPLPSDKPLAEAMNDYKEQSKTQTTHINRREIRQDRFLKLIDGL